MKTHKQTAGSTRTFNAERGDVLLLKLTGKMSLDKRRLEHTSATCKANKSVDVRVARGGRIAVCTGGKECGYYLSRTAVADEDELECGDLGRFGGHHGRSLGNEDCKCARGGVDGGLFGRRVLACSFASFLNGRFWVAALRAREEKFTQENITPNPLPLLRRRHHWPVDVKIPYEFQSSERMELKGEKQKIGA